jgi:hypothetical protein
MSDINETSDIEAASDLKAGATVTAPQDRALRVAKREERARDASRAMHEIKSEKQAELSKTARLKALRLANLATEAAASAKKRKPK